MKHIDGEDEGIFTSNFIQLLRSEKGNNKTIDFARLYKLLEPYCFSYPLLVHNKSTLISMLLKFLTDTEQINITAIQVSVLDLIVALIKDFRTDIYQEFIQRIMPAAISVIDMQKVQLLDKIFTLISFGVKYLSKNIKEDLPNFYEMYFELMIHKNRYIRKFAAQSISYVLRKATFSHELVQLLLKRVLSSDQEMKDQGKQQGFITIEDQTQVPHSQMDNVLGISEVFFEIMYGAAEGLHSKAQDVAQNLFKFYQNNSQNTVLMVIRALFVKLFNEVDTEKQQKLLELLVQNCNYKEQEQDLNTLMLVFKDVIKLKHGRRVSQYAGVQIIQVFNTLLTKNMKVIESFSAPTKANLAETMSLQYYFKHNQVLQVFHKQSIEFSNSKHIFNHNIFKLASTDSSHSILILKAYLGIMMMNSHEIKTEGDIDWSKILGIKQSSRNQVEFSKDSHQKKINLLVKSLNRHVLSQIQNSNDTPYILHTISIMLSLVGQLEESITVEISTDIEEKIIKILKNELKPIEKFIIFKFISLCKNGKALNDFVKHNIANKQSPKKSSFKQQKIQLTDKINENQILKNYALSKEQIAQLGNICESLFDIHNTGMQSRIEEQSKQLGIIFLQRCEGLQKDQVLRSLENNVEDIIILKSSNALLTDGLSVEKQRGLFNKLSQNLLKSQQEIRHQSLKLLNKFDLQEYSVAQKDAEISDLYKGHCNILKIMLQFEETPIAFDTEKTKILLIKKIQTVLECELVPEEYVEAAFNFLIGSFWVKFTPLFDSIQEALATVISQNPLKYGQKALLLLEYTGYLTQLTHDNDDLPILFGIDTCAKTDDLMTITYEKDAKLDALFMEVKDFFFNISKSVSRVIDHLFEHKDLKADLFRILYAYIDQEYKLIYQSRQTTFQSQSLIDLMTYANMIDSESFQKFRRQAYSKLYCYLEMLNRAETLKTIPRIDEFQALLLTLISSSDNKLQKVAFECLIKSEYSKGILKLYRKLLEGFTDDQKFKDMIQILNFGSTGGSGSIDKHGDNEDAFQVSKKAEKGFIPKLAEEHRVQVLPIVVKLLLSKLQKKKGAINQKTIHTRRTIVYNFMATLKDGPELDIFFNELLQPLNLRVDQEFSKIETKVAQVSFSNFLNFIGSLSVVIKSMGSLLNSYLPKITRVLIEVMKLTKLFIKQLKLTMIEDKQEDEINVSPDQEGQMGNKDNLYKFVGRQSKMSMRKSLAIVKQLYAKFSPSQDFVSDFSKLFYHGIVEDQLSSFSQNVSFNSLSFSISLTDHNQLKFQQSSGQVLSLL